MSVTVYLVGAGPGDPGLITVAAARALERAAVVIYDYLANPELLKLCPPTAELIYVGKSAKEHTKTQDQINQLLVDKARQLATLNTRASIVRLKGGDPYVFGRGGEEAEFLRAANIPFIEIPGITAGIAGPAYAGIPVTHRDFASTITLITGHERDPAPIPAEDATRINYTALAQLGGTLVFYMGVKSLPQITARLIAAGLPASTPAAVIRWATRPNQQTVTGTLETIAQEVQRAGLTAPAITIIGQVVALRPTLDWFDRRPLFGQRILVTRTRQQASQLALGLADLGAHILEAPTIELAEPTDWTPIDAALHQLHTYDWLVFTSANGVQAAWQRLRHLGRDARAFPPHVAAIGPATAAALDQIGITANLIPEKFIGEELAHALCETAGHIAGKKFLLRADIARPILRDSLTACRAIVKDLPIYRTLRPAALPADVLDALRTNSLDWVTFTSASTATNLFEMLPENLRPNLAAIKKLSIGPITTAALKQIGWPPHLEAPTHTIEGMIAALMNHKTEALP